jgi:membrane protease YdiL (CAAX protease family)
MLISFKEIERQKVLGGIFLTIVLLAAWMFGSKILGLALAHTLSKQTLFLISRLTFWLYFAIVFWYAHKQEKLPFILWPEKSYSALYSIVSVIVLYLVVGAGAVAISLVVRLFGPLEASNKIKGMLQFDIPVKLLAVITAAVAEELIFRAYLIPRLKVFFKNIHLPVIISAFIFGIAHASYGTVVNTAVPLFIGLLFGYHYYKYRNLKILVICHFMIDFISIFFARH